MFDATFEFGFQGPGCNIFGSALCHFGEASLPEAVKKLRRVAAGCGKDVGRDIKRKEVLARNVEAFQGKPGPQETRSTGKRKENLCFHGCLGYVLDFCCIFSFSGIKY